MRRLILGTAGHIDHGKTELVKALTGIDTDRLKEEKERGITIDLGFASLTDGELRMGVVDVPGHEGFIRNMVAGASGMDVVVLVIAADEGVMPQTREHVDIVTLLGVERLVVALTKRDLVDEEWLELVGEDVRALLAPTPYGEAPMFATSTRTGEGLDALRAALLETARGDEDAGSERDLARLPIDRVFTMRGTGTVVTGTLWSGAFHTGEKVRVLPGGLDARVRGVQVHGEEVPEARAGERTALALVGAEIERSALERGQAVVRNAGWEESSMLTARLRLLPDTSWSLEPNQRVRVHLGTSEVMARCVLLGGDALLPGDEGWAQLRMESPVLARAGDALVLRSYSPLATIGGGTVAEPQAPKRSRLASGEAELLAALLADEPEAAAAAALELAGWAGVTEARLPVLTRHPPATCARALARLREAGALEVAGRTLAPGRVAEARAELLRAVDAFHAAEPLRPGMAAEALRPVLPEAAPHGLADTLLQGLVAEGALTVRSGTVARPGFRPVLTAEQERVKGELGRLYREAGLAPPAVEELPDALRRRNDLWPLLKLLEGEGALISLDEGLFVCSESLAAATRAVAERLGGRSGLGPADFKEVLAVTRKHLLPILAHLDSSGVTIRREGGRDVPAR